MNHWLWHPYANTSLGWIWTGLPQLTLWLTGCHSFQFIASECLWFGRDDPQWEPTAESFSSEVRGHGCSHRGRGDLSLFTVTSSVHSWSLTLINNWDRLIVRWIEMCKHNQTDYNQSIFLQFEMWLMMSPKLLFSARKLNCFSLWHHSIL